MKGHYKEPPPPPKEHYNDKSLNWLILNSNLFGYVVFRGIYVGFLMYSILDISVAGLETAQNFLYLSYEEILDNMMSGRYIVTCWTGNNPLN